MKTTLLKFSRSQLHVLKRSRCLGNKSRRHFDNSRYVSWYGGLLRDLQQICRNNSKDLAKNLTSIQMLLIKKKKKWVERLNRDGRLCMQGLLVKNLYIWNFLQISFKEQGSARKKIVSDVWPYCDLDAVRIDFRIKLVHLLDIMIIQAKMGIIF